MSNKKDLFQNFIGNTKVSKTLRFSLIPQNSQENLKSFLTNDEKRASSYIVMKNLFNRCHRELIEKILIDEETNPSVDWISFEENYIAQKDNSEQLAVITSNARKTIAKRFEKCEEKKMLFGKEPFDEKNNYFEGKGLSDEEKIAVQEFLGFSAYFTNFFQNRERIYSAEEKHGTIAYRLINENFTIHMTNRSLFNQITLFEPELINMIDDSYMREYGNKYSYFVPGGFQHALSQTGIDAYNDYIGYVNKELNLYYQKHQYELQDNHLLKKHKSRTLLTLYKMILSDVGKNFVIHKLESDEEVFAQIDELESLFSIDDLQKSTQKLMSIADEADLSKVFLPRDGFTTLSNQIYGRWNQLESILAEYLYHSLSDKIKKEKLDDEVQKALKRDFFPISEIEEAASYYSDTHTDDSEFAEIKDILSIVKESIEQQIDTIRATRKAYTLFKEQWNSEEPLKQIDITVIKEYMDANIGLMRLLKLFWQKKLNLSLCDTAFYSRLQDLLEQLQPLNETYDLVRNYVTQKPYSKDKIVLKFDCPTIGLGWSINKERDNCCLILRDNGKYFLLIMNPKNKPKIVGSMTDGGNCYEKMNYNQFKDVSKMIPKCSISTNEVKNAFTSGATQYQLDNKSFLLPFTITEENYSLAQETEYGVKQWQIDYLRKTKDEKGYQNAVKKWIAFCYEFLKDYGSTSMYDFTPILPLSKYTSVSEFYNEVDKILYSIDFSYVPKAQIDEYVKNGQAYLFQIYSKDFSEGHKVGSKKNLHTLYWEFLFDERNKQQKIIKLNGGAEIFYRAASISKPVVHEANSILVNKRTIDGKTIPAQIYCELAAYYNGQADHLSEEAQKYSDQIKTSTRKYDLIKDRRFTKDQYEIHVPITINYNADGYYPLNKYVQTMIRDNTEICTIGLDRGERNLITYSVCNAEGKILEQGSFNQIDAVDYQEKLKQKEQDRQIARKDWKSIENIKELKEGYLSQVVHKLAELMVKYQAFIVMEDLNFGFKKGRFGVERQVYQKFELALLKKLEYLVLNKEEASALTDGGVLRGYQLTYTPASLTDIGKQCGCIFYVQPAFTSKIDPTTGFSDVFNYNEYSDRELRKDFFQNMKSIRYDEKEDTFLFTFDYNNFKTLQTFDKTLWTIWTGNPCLVWDSADKKQETIDVTQKLKELFRTWNIDINKLELKDQILCIPTTKDKADFWSNLFYLFRLSMTMRYSVVGGMEDRILSPVVNARGERFCTAPYENLDFDAKHRFDEFPMDADANGAYHIALKGQLLFEQIRHAKLNSKGEMPAGTMAVRNADWFKFVQNR